MFTRFEETGEVEPLKQPLKEDQGKLDCHHELLLIALVLETPTIYLHELCEMLHELKLQVFVYLKPLFAGC